MLATPIIALAAEKLQPEVLVVENVPIEVVEEPQPKEVQIKVSYTTDGIKQLIRETFPEDPETALRVAYCESGYKMVQSHHIQPYGREQSFGIFQIHAPDWHSTANRVGYPEYQDDIEQNIKMARYIYESAGNTWRPWSCYTKQMI